MQDLYLRIGIEMAVWLVGMIASVISILVAALAPRRLFFGSLALALIAVGVGSAGYWRPGSWPRFGYTRSTDAGWELSIGSPSLFVAPLLLGALALIFVLWRRRAAGSNQTLR